MINELKELFTRDLEKVKEELMQYAGEDQLYKVRGDIKNAAGNLIMHINGNLLHYIGAVLGQTAYHRNRDFEFEGRLTVEELSKDIDLVIEVINLVLPKLSADVLEAEYPAPPPTYKMNTGKFLLHLYGHLHWHLGQINYHRRLINS